MVNLEQNYSAIERTLKGRFANVDDESLKTIQKQITEEIWATVFYFDVFGVARFNSQKFYLYLVNFDTLQQYLAVKKHPIQTI
jgi:hypothetical protein